ncbi:Cullin homology [Amanita muscaria]
MSKPPCPKLSKRLIHSVYASDEAEACRFEYSNKLQRMFTGAKVLTDSFKERMAANHPDDQDIMFSIMVLGTNFWPLNLATHDFVIPTEIATAYDRFPKYYQTKHSGRKLVVKLLQERAAHQLSQLEMAVLLQYNRHDTLSLEEIQAATAISKDILLQVLALLVKAKVLINEENDQYDPKSRRKFVST